MGSPQYPTDLDTNGTLLDDLKPIYLTDRVSIRELRQAIITIQAFVGKTDSDDTDSLVYLLNKVISDLSSHESDTSTHGASDIADVSDIAVDANLSAAGQDAISKKHTQNTDTGLDATYEATFPYMVLSKVVCSDNEVVCCDNEIVWNN